MTLTSRDRETLRRLAGEYMEAASLPVQREKMLLWKSHNRLDRKRPMLNIDQRPWNELEAADGAALRCTVEEPFFRDIERTLRRQLYQWRHFPVDMVLEPYLSVPAAIYQSGYGLTRVEEVRRLVEGETASSHRYLNQLRELEDIEKIRDIHVTADAEESRRRLDAAAEAFGADIPLRLSRGLQFHLGVWDRLSEYMGVETCYIEMLDRPELIHAAMRRLTDSTLNGIREANALAVHADDVSVCHCSYIYTDELLPDFGAGKGSVSKNCWSFGLAQLFSSVSPAMFEEFELPYIAEMAEPFGMIYYGCCDRLDDRLDLVARIPHVKKVSCSPWSRREEFAEKLDKTLVMSNKPSPALLAVDSFDEAAVRADLRRTIECAERNGLALEMILKDVSTVRFDPRRLEAWSRIALEEAGA